jgi:hypothetical protein
MRGGKMTHRPFLGTVSSLRQAYPEVKTLFFEGEQSGELAREHQRHLRYSESTLPAKIPCGNPRCRQGGFDLNTTLMSVAHDKKPGSEGKLYCNGHEGTPKGRRIGDPCFNTVSFILSITYEDHPIS